MPLDIIQRTVYGIIMSYFQYQGVKIMSLINNSTKNTENTELKENEVKVATEMVDDIKFLINSGLQLETEWKDAKLKEYHISLDISNIEEKLLASYKRRDLLAEQLSKQFGNGNLNLETGIYTKSI
jgi:hypothetical protein